LFHSYFEHRKYKKNALVLKEETVAEKAFFVINGGFRQFFYDENGLEKTLYLFYYYFAQWIYAFR
jgi:hypothetical protein